MLSIVYSVWFTKYEITYFNETLNIESIAYHCEESIDGCGEWTTDYWGFSGKKIGSSSNHQPGSKF
ncbi:hypothetical protein CM15mP35_06340 [bacterium]|nr:MAG: hypothetical protein CM15mP35_06340 [bacterium]